MDAAIAQWTSTLSTEALAQNFRQTAESIFGGTSRKLLGAMPGRGLAGKMQFFTPSSDNDPFAQFDKAVFSVGVQGPRGGKLNGAMLITIHMNVYEEDGRRRVQYGVPVKGQQLSAGKANDHLEMFGRGLQAADQSARRTS